MFYTRSEKAVHCGEPKRSERGHTETGQDPSNTKSVLCCVQQDQRAGFYTAPLSDPSKYTGGTWYNIILKLT